MLYKITMILTLLVVVATGVVNEIKVNAHIQEELRLDKAADDKKTEEDGLRNASQGRLTTYTDAHTHRQQTLAQAQQEDQRQAQLVSQTQAGVQAAQQAENAAMNERNTTRRSNQDFKGLNMEIAEIKRIRNKLPNVERALSTAKSERDIVTKDNQRMRDQIVRMAPPEKKPLLPHGLRGKIVSVDQKYQYVVLDIGKHHGVEPKGEMMISRDGALLGKIKITRAEADYSIANILQDWKDDEPVEGDLVIYGGL